MACSCGSDTCGCSVPQVVYLRDETGEAHSFYITDRIEVEHKEYVLLAGVEEADLMALLRVEKQEDGSEQYLNIESEAEWATLQEVLVQQS